MLKKKLMAVCLCTAMTVSCLAGCSSSSEDADGTTVASSKADETATTTTGDDSATTAESTTAQQFELNPFDPLSVSYNDYVDVSKWKEAVVKKEDVIEDEDVVEFAIINSLVTTFGFERTETEDAVKNGDIATIDFDGFVDDKALEGGSGTDYELTIGANQFIEGFESGLIGAKKGDKVTLDLTFPDPYPNNPDIAGKPVKFEVTVKKVDTLDTSKVDDATIKEKTNGKYETYAAYVDGYKSERAENFKNDKIWATVMEEQIEQKGVCQELADDFINTYLYTFSQYSNYFGMTLEQYLAYYGYKTVDEFKEGMKDTAAAYSKQTCAVLALADAENVEVSDDELDKAFAEAIAEYENEAEAEKAGITKNGVKFDLILDKVQELIYKSIEVQ